MPAELSSINSARGSKKVEKFVNSTTGQAACKENRTQDIVFSFCKLISYSVSYHDVHNGMVPEENIYLRSGFGNLIYR